MVTNENLIEIAKQAREYAYAPFSKFKVGAALLDTDGSVFQGCNIEDPSAIGITNICAERCAVTKAISSGSKPFMKIAIVGGINELVKCLPCGVCRQYLNSFAPNIIIVVENNSTIEEYTLRDLLPHAYNETFNN